MKRIQMIGMVLSVLGALLASCAESKGTTTTVPQTLQSKQSVAPEGLAGKKATFSGGDMGTRINMKFKSANSGNIMEEDWTEEAETVTYKKTGPDTATISISDMSLSMKFLTLSSGIATGPMGKLTFSIH